MLTRFILYIAYRLKTSLRYQSFKGFFYNLLNNPQSKIKPYFDVFMIMMVLSSVSLLIYEVEHEINTAAMLFEDIVIVIFICEYLLRGWLHSNIHNTIIKQYEKSEYLGTPFKLHKTIALIIKNKLGYVFSLTAIIDLLAILPSYRPLRILRIFLIFRLFKLLRYSQSIKMFTGVLSGKRLELTTLAIFMSFITFIASTAIYMFENVNTGGKVTDLYDAFYWAIITISTVGYGDITPVTAGGRIVTGVLIIIGLGGIAFFTSIIVASFNERMHEFQEDRIKANLEKGKHGIILCGFGGVGQGIATQLHANKDSFVVIDKNPLYTQLAKDKGYIAIEGDAHKNSVLETAGINIGAHTIVCATGDDVTNVYITLTSRYLNSDITIISRANRQDNVKKMYQAGATHIVQPFTVAGLLAAKYIGQPVAFDAINGLLQNDKKSVQMGHIPIKEYCFLDNMSLEEINIEQYKLRLIGVVSHNKSYQTDKNHYKLNEQIFYFNPKTDFRLHQGDTLILLGRHISFEYLHNLIETGRLEKQYHG